MARFHPLKVTDVRRETRDAVVVTLMPRDGRQRFVRRSPQGQYLTFRRDFDGDRAAPLLFDLRRVRTKVFSRSASSASMAARSRPGRTRPLQPGARSKPCRRWDSFFTPIEPDARRNYIGFAGGSGITPRALHHQDRARPGALVAASRLVYANRQDQLDHVPRGTGGSEKPASRPVLRDPCSRSRGARIDLFTGRVDGDKVKALFRTLDRCWLYRHGFHLRPPADDAGDCRGAARARAERHADQVRAVCLRPAGPGQGQEPCPGGRRTPVTGFEATVTLDGATRSFIMPTRG